MCLLEGSSKNLLHRSQRNEVPVAELQWILRSLSPVSYLLLAPLCSVIVVDD